MLTTLIALVVAILPGALLGFVLPAGPYRWATWVSAPALTLGLTTVAMGWLPKIGLPHGAGAVLVAEVVLAGVAILTSQLPPRMRAARPGGTQVGRDSDERSDEVSVRTSRIRFRPVLPRRADLIGVSVPAVISVGYGWLLLGRLIAPPGWDAMNHGYFTRRILDTGSATIASACSTGSTESVLACSFYPLATNVSWAQAAELSGGHISTVLTAWIILIGPLSLITGVYACTRVLGGGVIVAACAATAPTFLGPLWLSAVTGRVTQQTGPCMAAGIALLAALAIRGHHSVRLGLLAGLAGAGLIMSHTYDVLFLAILTLALLPLLRGSLTLPGSGAGIGAVVLGGIGAIAPFIGPLTSANGERDSNPPALLGKIGEAFDYWVSDPQRYVLFGYPAPGGADYQLNVPAIQAALVLTIACLLASPLCLVFRQLRWARPWFVAGVIFTAIGVWTTSSDSAPAMILSSMWYGVRERLRSMILPVYGLLAVAGAVVFGLIIQRLLVTLVARARALRESVVPAAVAAAGLVLSLAMLAALPDAWRPIRAEFKSRAPVGQSYVEAYRWLAENTPPGKVVAYDRHRQFMTWSYIDYGAPVLFGLPPLPVFDVENYDRRWDAWNWLVNSPDARLAGCEVRRFNVEYVVVGGGRYMPGGWDRHYDPERIDLTDRLTLAHQVGKIKIYRVTEVGRACGASA